jgi:tetratricopeptide (TPR) repeat protein
MRGWLRAYRAIIIMRDAGALDAIYAAFRASPFGRDIALTIWEARIEFFRMLGGERSDFEKIKKAARDNPTNSNLLFFMARGYQEFGDHQTAACTFEDAAAKAEKDAHKLSCLAFAASQYAQAGQWNRSNEIVERLKREVAGKPDLQYEFLSAFRDLAEAEKNDGLQLAIMEQMVELRPDDTSARFSLAFKHSVVGNSDMALHHYLKIPLCERDATTWNNLGVAYGDFGMPIKAVDAFRESEKENETLAMCNLGFKLLSSGFLPEAQLEADKAISIKPHHKNVPELLTRLNGAQDEEEDKLTETLEKTKVKAAFYRKLGEGVLKATPLNIAPNWNSPEGALEGKMDGTSVRIIGAHKRPLNALAGLFQPSGLLGQAMVTHRIEYSGEVRGNVIFGHVKRSMDGEAPSLLGSTDNNVKTVMIFNEDHTELFVMEHPGNLHPLFYTLTRSS